MISATDASSSPPKVVWMMQQNSPDFSINDLRLPHPFIHLCFHWFMLQDVCSVHIKLVDANDNAPVPIDWPTKLFLPTDGTEMGQNARLTTLRAEDADEGRNGEVVFMLDNDPSGMFDLEPVSGELTFMR